MSEFEKWCNKDNVSSYYYSVSKEAFKAGAQSKQAEIDDHIKRRLKLAKEKQGLINERDELRKRIDKVVHILTYTNHASTPLCNELRDILKGTTNEQ